MLTPLNKASFVPLYHQLKLSLRERVRSGEWNPGEVISSERELINEYQVSRATVRQAISELVNEGTFRRVQGRGTFVAEPKLEQGLTKFYSFTEEMRRRGLNPRSAILSLEKAAADRRIAEALNIGMHDPIYKLTRLRLVDEVPMMFESSYLPISLVPELDREELERKPLYTVLTERFGMKMVRATEYFEPVITDEYEAEMLEVNSSSPALLLERITYSLKETPVEFCKSIVRGDKCRYYVDLIAD